MLRGIILDLDGLLMDSEHWSWQAHNDVLAKYKLAPLSLNEVRQLVGLAGPDEWMALSGMRTVRGDRSSYDALHGDSFSLIRARHMAPMPGVRELLATAKQLALRVGLASNSAMPHIISALEGLEISTYFDALASGAEVRRGKPAPDVYLRALELLDLRAEDAAAMEDSRVGCEAATAAGLRCIAVPNEITAEQDFAKALEIFESLHEATAWLHDQVAPSSGAK